MSNRHAALLLISVVLTALCGCLGSDSQTTIATLKESAGSVDCRNNPDDRFQPATVGQTLSDNASIRTGENSSALLAFSIGGRLKLSSNSFFLVKQGNCIGSQNAGNGLFEIDKQAEKISIETPQGLTTILGTKFKQTVTQDKVELVLYEGLIEFSSQEGKTVRINPGEKLLIEAGNPPGEPVKIDDFNIDELFNSEKSNKSY
ncbi:MAG: hypothetical protein CVV42_18435 [Candidatus Riflebacteria bacterium HGW-Riflebacteria-2]|jgi:hypothetical protein|nr:MAG: hypothetical protein CVV42_18435 [Candidatus Riflebacteria bacterium HGW-Riflebacteria-2]